MGLIILKKRRQLSKTSTSVLLANSPSIRYLKVNRGESMELNLGIPRSIQVGRGKIVGIISNRDIKVAPSLFQDLKSAEVRSLFCE